MIKMLTVLVNTISNSQVFLLKNVSSYSHFFCVNISVYTIFNDQKFGLRKQIGQLLKMTTMVASQQENKKQNGQTNSGQPRC